jgi:hypothetical protein
MPNDNLKPALRTALRLHEIGDASPYQIFFAAKGKSGASFGFMQGDLAAGQAVVTKTFRDILTAANLTPSKIDSLVARLSVHMVSNPLNAADTRLVNNALFAGKPLVDAMDEAILGDIYNDLDSCIASATQSGRSIIPKGLIYMALWINMTGKPTSLRRWLEGKDPGLPHRIPKAKNLVDGSQMETYLRATHYYTDNPGNMPHMMHSAAAGAAMIP